MVVCHVRDWTTAYQSHWLRQIPFVENVAAILIQLSKSSDPTLMKCGIVGHPGINFINFLDALHQWMIANWWNMPGPMTPVQEPAWWHWVQQIGAEFTHYVSRCGLYSRQHLLSLGSGSEDAARKNDSICLGKDNVVLMDYRSIHESIFIYLCCI